MPIMTHLISDARLAARWRAHLGTPPVSDPLRRLNQADADRRHAWPDPDAQVASPMPVLEPKTAHQVPGHAHQMDQHCGQTCIT
jgi:hypothetical protein